MDLQILAWPGLIFDLFYQCYQAQFLKKRLRPVCSFAVTPPVQSNNFKIQNPPVVGWAACALYDPFPPPESKRK
jgi:hypothetical protein